MKYKVWCKNSRAWETHPCVMGQDGSLMHYQGERLDALRPETHVPVFYTRLKDSELTEEYFGDVVEAEDGTRWVIEDGNSAVLYRTVGTTGVRYFWNLPVHSVIGNIYENPELIDTP